jgi:hypothetical protein
MLRQMLQMDDLILLDELLAATAQERFLVMINERVGGIEDAVREMRGTLADVAAFLTTDVASIHIHLPKSACADIDTAFLERTIAAVQRTRGVVVATAWAVLIGNVFGATSDYHTMSIYLRFKARLVLTNASEEMNDHLQVEFGLKNSHLNPWSASSMVRIERAISESSPQVVRLDADDGTHRL